MNWDAQNARPQLITDKIGMVGSCFQHFPLGSSFEHFPMPIPDLHNHGSFCKHIHDASIHFTTTTSHTTSCIRQVCVCVIVDQYPLLDIGFYDFTTFGCSAIGFLHQILVGIGDLGDDWCWNLVLGRRLVRLQNWCGNSCGYVTNFGLVLWVTNFGLVPLVTNFGLELPLVLSLFMLSDFDFSFDDKARYVARRSCARQVDQGQLVDGVCVTLTPRRSAELIVHFLTLYSKCMVFRI